jgi:hypothetical protein
MQIPCFKLLLHLFINNVLLIIFYFSFIPHSPCQGVSLLLGGVMGKRWANLGFAIGVPAFLVAIATATAISNALAISARH